METCPLKIVAGSRPHYAETENGDAWSVSHFPGLCRISLIDGLGHGPYAASATAVALQTLKSLGPVQPAEVIRRCNLALSGTRGVVMGVANIDLRDSSVAYAAVGNTDGLIRIGDEGVTTRLLSDRGIVGTTLPTIRSVVIPLQEPWQLLLFTDGVRDRFNVRDELQAEAESSNWPAEFLERWGRTHDDATVILVSPR
ncbi:MAG: SpoIIE family protein phosphatase [Nitrolancea sp.]